MDTMEVDSNDMDGGRGLDDPEEPSTPDERMFDLDSHFLDREKDEEPIKTIRWEEHIFHNFQFVVQAAKTVRLLPAVETLFLI